MEENHGIVIEHTRSESHKGTRLITANASAFS